MNVALYARVSTDQQDAANQIPEIEQLVQARGWKITHRYIETVSGTAKHRPELERMLADAHKGKFGAVICWALDRLSRNGIAEVAGIVAKLDKAAVGLVSVREQWADTSGPVRDLLVAVMSWVAQQERARLVERTKAGIEKARAKGTRLGRPPVAPAVLERGLRLVAEGEPLVHAAKLVGCSPAKLRQARSAARMAAQAGGLA
jgi:DNA invertase Pin-like site-specific DNA recombinase